MPGNPHKRLPLELYHSRRVRTEIPERHCSQNPMKARLSDRWSGHQSWSHAFRSLNGLSCADGNNSLRETARGIQDQTMIGGGLALCWLGNKSPTQSISRDCFAIFHAAEMRCLFRLRSASAEAQTMDQLGGVVAQRNDMNTRAQLDQMGQVYLDEHAKATLANLVYPISDPDRLTPTG